MTDKPKILIDVISDVMCPWCYIGKRNLDQAIANSPDIDIAVQWRPFQLDPTIPNDGMDRQTYLNNKFGAERAVSFYNQIRQAGKEVGIDFKFEDIDLSPNTLNSHRLIHWAGGQSNKVQYKLVERLFQIYFLEGGNLTDISVLAGAAEFAGMDPQIVTELLEGDQDIEQVTKDIGFAQEIGVQGVPFFIIDQKYALTGAQPADALVSAFQNVLLERAKEN